VTTLRLPLPPAWSAARTQLRARWVALPPRERRLAALGLGVLLIFLLWVVALQPAWRTVRDTPARLDRTDVQLQHMQRLAAESRELRNATPLSASQSGAALKTATDVLGDKARLSLQGERAVLTLTGVTSEQLRNWLSDARARVVEAQVSRSPQGYFGSVVVSLGGGTP
jgi:general secretion pathway protein M